MTSANQADPARHDGASIIPLAEAYLARLPDIAGEDIQAMLADGMRLVSGLLCGAGDNLPAQESHRRLASLVLAKMQRITRETSDQGKPGAYPCFTS